MLGEHHLIGFIPTADAERARAFYVDVLGLSFVDDDGFALVVRAGTSTIRIVRMGPFTPASYTILGWETPQIAATVQGLAARGVVFLRFSYFEQDEAGVWTSPSGSRVAWFHDPDGNTLSLSQH